MTGTGRNIAILLGVAGIVAAVVWMRHPPNTSPKTEETAAATSATDQNTAGPGGVPAPSAPSSEQVRLPRMIDLGADQCQACKALAPIIEGLEKELAGRATIRFIDVWKAPQAGQEFGIRVIPTQIFYDRDGLEVWRHEGFISREEILAKLEECGM